MRKSVRDLAERVLKVEQAAARTALAEARAAAAHAAEALAAQHRLIQHERLAATSADAVPFAAAHYADWHLQAALHLAIARAAWEAAEAACEAPAARLAEFAGKLNGLDLHDRAVADHAARRALATDPLRELAVLRAASGTR